MNVIMEIKILIWMKVYKMLMDIYILVFFYLKLRDYFIDFVLLENNDFCNKEDCFFFMGFEFIVSF